MSHARRLSLSCQRIPDGMQLRSLLVHQNVKLVFAEMLLETSRMAFVLTSQARTAILAVTPPSY